MNATTKARIAVLSAGFGAALLFTPSVYAQAESIPDHFTEAGAEVGPSGNLAQPAARSTASKPAQIAKSFAARAAQTTPSTAPVQVADAVTDKNRSAAPRAPKR